MRGERVCASRSHSEKSSGRPPPKSTSLRKKGADGNLRRNRHLERPSADRLRYNALRRPPHPSSSPLRRPPIPPPSSHGTYVRMLVTYVRTLGGTLGGQHNLARTHSSHSARGHALRIGARSSTTTQGTPGTSPYVRLASEVRQVRPRTHAV